ncbi:MAG: hypothetical protein KKD01_00455 [Proteobacteria bacterium]|nr:hypothetical protein [Pseudomonadota bacterium]MBU1137696.1 hypothetical protein [Pseudomonadota bacterium]MBU1231350.1 hypothetical protein [Pseudomonadota bacterium]MBU1417820.1 hypothetical protein [Pseudomonadota bacterium]MBU1453168.1 hypothetical protein [Pseudomonadota bacterium]
MFDVIGAKGMEKVWADFRNCFDSELAEEFLQSLLTLMQIVFVINHDYRRNLDKFNGRYQFRSVDGEVTIGVLFANSRMKVVEGMIDSPHITVTFRDGRTLMNFIISPRQDILGSMLKHDVKTEGNLNYLYKFGFMAKQLQLMIPQPA